jgi:hypothetical protein
MDVLEVQDEVTTSSIPLDKLAAIYIRIRDAKDDLTETTKQKSLISMSRWAYLKHRC